MKINKNSLQARINNLSKEMNIHANVLLESFFERAGRIMRKNLRLQKTLRLKQR